MVLQRKKQLQLDRASVKKTFAKRTSLAHCSHGTKNVHALRAALPQLWRKFSTGADKAALTVDDLQAWLRTAKTHVCLARESKASLLKALNAVARMPRLQQRLGYRFQDPSGGGSWECTNLKGYNSKIVSKMPRQRWEVSWASYFIAFQLHVLDQDALEISRNSGTSKLSAQVEKCPHSAKALAQGEMVTVTAFSRRKEAQRSRKKLKVERRRADLLPAVIFRPVHPSKVPLWTVIYLHGFSSTAFEQYGNAPHYFLDGSIAVKVVVPTAPKRELSIFDSWWVEVQGRRPARSTSASGRAAAKRPRWKLNQFNAWFDYLSNNDGKREDTLDVESLHVMRKVLHQLILKEAAEQNGRTDRVILAGKSQGCCTALDAALTFPQKLGGFIGIVGHLLGCTPLEADGSQMGTPLHFFHEVNDDIMKWAWVQQGMQRLKSLGYDVHSRRAKDPEGNGHYVGGGFESRSIRQALYSITSSTNK